MSGHSWEIFKRVWENYLIASGLREKDESQKVATFLMMIGEGALEIYNTFKLRSEEKNINTIM